MLFIYQRDETKQTTGDCQLIFANVLISRENC